MYLYYVYVMNKMVEGSGSEGTPKYGACDIRDIFRL